MESQRFKLKFQSEQSITLKNHFENLIYMLILIIYTLPLLLNETRFLKNLVLSLDTQYLWENEYNFSDHLWN